MSEITKYEAQKKKMQGLCEEHDLTYRFRKDRYPITFTIKPTQGMDAQLSMLENVEEIGYRSPDATMTWIFEDGVLETKVTGGTFTISKTLRQKIEGILVKMISFWQQYFFRDVIEKQVLTRSTMPVIDVEDADERLDEDLDDCDDEADEETTVEEADDGEEEEDNVVPFLAADDPDVLRATNIVRAEGNATTALLQRRMNVGYAEAEYIMDTLEELGVVGPYNGSDPREVLPYDGSGDASEEVDTPESEE